MKRVLASLIAIAMVYSLASCKKDSASNNNNNNTAASFTWTENGGAVMTADSAKWTTGNWGTGIRAWKATGSYFFEINWDLNNNTSVGAKALTLPYGLTMLKAGSATGYVISAASTLNVTAFANDKLSGNFSVPATSGATTINISGTFTNIPKY